MGIWGSYCNIPRAIFYLLKGDYICGLPAFLRLAESHQGEVLGVSAGAGVVGQAMDTDLKTSGRKGQDKTLKQH